MPPELAAIVAKHVNAPGTSERADLAQLNASLQKEITDHRLVFNQAKTDTFRDKLRKAGSYEEWKGKYGNDAWAILEKYSGRLA
jgi:hypothetical protein